MWLIKIRVLFHNMPANSRHLWPVCALSVQPHIPMLLLNNATLSTHQHTSFTNTPHHTTLSIHLHPPPTHTQPLTNTPHKYVDHTPTQGAIVGIENPTNRIYGLQYHPEVVHSERGKETLHRFLFDLAQLSGDWKMENVLHEEMDKIRAQVGPTDHVICALSGGVDSTVAATLVHRVLGDRLHCVFVDNGLLRYNEAERVMTTFQEQLHLPVTKVRRC